MRIAPPKAVTAARLSLRVISGGLARTGYGGETLLERLADVVVSAAPLTPDGGDPALIPEPMPNTSHADMLRDIARHIRRTRSLGTAFDSWVD